MPLNSQYSVLAFSGGMDSTSLLLNLLKNNQFVYAVSFNYGQKHVIEIEHASRNIEYLINNGFKFINNPYGRKLTKNETIELAADCVGIIAGVETYDKNVIDRLINLKCISRVGVGIDSIDIDYLEKRLKSFNPNINFIRTTVEQYGLTGLSAHYTNLTKEQYTEAIESLWEIRLLI